MNIMLINFMGMERMRELLDMRINTIALENMVAIMQEISNTVLIHRINIMNDAIIERQNYYNNTMKKLYKFHSKLIDEHRSLQNQLNVRELMIFRLNNKLQNEEYANNVYVNRSFYISYLPPFKVINFGEFLNVINYNELLKRQSFDFLNVKENIISLRNKNRELLEEIELCHREIAIKEEQAKELELYNRNYLTIEPIKKNNTKEIS